MKPSIRAESPRRATVQVRAMPQTRPGWHSGYRPLLGCQGDKGFHLKLRRAPPSFRRLILKGTQRPAAHLRTRRRRSSPSAWCTRSKAAPWRRTGRPLDDCFAGQRLTCRGLPDGTAMPVPPWGWSARFRELRDSTLSPPLAAAGGVKQARRRRRPQNCSPRVRPPTALPCEQRPADAAATCTLAARRGELHTLGLSPRGLARLTLTVTA